MSETKITTCCIISFLMICLSGCGRRGALYYHDMDIINSVPGDQAYCPPMSPITPNSLLLIRDIKVSKIEDLLKSKEDAQTEQVYQDLERNLRKKLQKKIGSCSFFKKIDINLMSSIDQQKYYVDLIVDAKLFTNDKMNKQMVGYVSFGPIATMVQDRQSMKYVISVYDEENNLLAQFKSKNILWTGYADLSSLILNGGGRSMDMGATAVLCNLIESGYMATHDASQ